MVQYSTVLDKKGYTTATVLQVIGIGISSTIYYITIQCNIVHYSAV